MRSVRSKPGNDFGYTLIELLISLTILALLLAMVPSTLRLGKRAWETPGGLEDNPAVASLTFAGQQLRSALPLYETDANGLPRMIFEGAPHRVSFITELATGPSGGGLYRIDLSGAPSEPNQPVLRLTLYREGRNAELRSSEQRELASGFSSVAFNYFGSPAPGAAARWQNTWPRTDRLPDIVDVVATPKTPRIPSTQLRTELKLRPVL
jgi:general secretion pathway protein J